MATSTAARKPSTKRSTNAPKQAEPVTNTPTEDRVADPIVDMLKRYEFTYDLATLRLAEINRKQSELNQARIAKPIDEDVVVIYAQQMNDGDDFPPIVVYKTAQGFIVMDGNHRVAASDIADRASIQAYVVRDPSPAQIQAYTFEANTKHGLPTSLQDRLQQAIFLHEQGVTVREAATRLGVNPNQLTHALDTYFADQRFQRLGIRKFDKLSMSAKRKLDSVHSDVVLKDVAELAIDASMNLDDIARLVRDVNAIRSGERDQRKAVSDAREARQTTIKATAGGRIPVAVNLQTLARAMTTINRLDIKTVEKQMANLTPDARQAYGRAASDTVTKAMEVIRIVQRAATK